MYKLLVADDEQIVLDSIRFIVQRKFNGIIQVETARSGREAIEKAEEYKPDIVFMDIKMPGINGVDAIREIKLRLSNVIFIIISAYEQFDFAKEAVKLDVSEYLLKPVNRYQIIDVIEKSISSLERERQKRLKELELKEKLENIIPILENGFIYSLIVFDDNKKELQDYLNILEITEPGGYVMSIEFGERDDSGNIANKIGFSVRGETLYPHVRNIIKSCCKCIMGPMILNRIVVFIPSTIKNDEYEQRVEIISTAEHIFGKLQKKIGSDFCIGIGRCYKGIENLVKSYEESVKAIRFAEGKGIVHITDVLVESKAGKPYPKSIEKSFLAKASLGDTESCIQLFNTLFDWIVMEYGGSISEVRGNVLELMVLLHRHIWDCGIEDDGYPKKQDYIEELLSIQDLNIMKKWCRERIHYLTRAISGLKEKRISNAVLRAKEYIDKNFHLDITLEDVSKDICISPHYLSRLFKEEMGENFIDYLTNVRINKAKEYLKEGLFSVKEICYEVGYGDPSYFCRIFKKVVGTTPTEYKELQENKR